MYFLFKVRGKLCYMLDNMHAFLENEHLIAGITAFSLTNAPLPQKYSAG